MPSTLLFPSFPKADVSAEMTVTLDLKSKASLHVRYSGTWALFREIGNTTQRVGKAAVDSTGYIQVRLDFPTPVTPGGQEMSNIRDALARLQAGRLALTAFPDKENP